MLKRHLGQLTCGLALFLAAASASAQAFPARPIRIIVPFGPGGSTDVVVRIISPKLSERIGQPVIVENRPGGGATIGMNAVAKAAPDGYTLGVANVAFGSNPSIMKQLPYDPQKDFAPISLLTLVPMVLSINPTLPAKSVKDLVALAKSKPDALNYSSAGSGSPNQLAAERFSYETGIKLRHIPYTGGAAAVLSTIAGDTQILFATIPSAAQHFKSGKLMGLAVTALKRYPTLPDIPTVAETGVAGFEVYEWQGIVAPAGTPQAVLDRLEREIAAVMALPDVKSRLEGVGALPQGSTAQEFRAFLAKEMATWPAIVKAAGIQQE